MKLIDTILGQTVPDFPESCLPRDESIANPCIFVRDTNPG